MLPIASIRSHGSRAGFTLLEVTAALAIVGVLFFGLAVLLRQIGDARDRIVAESRGEDVSANGTRLLHALVGSAEASTDTSQRFIGTPSSAAFMTWCPTPGGWLERCRVQLNIVPFGDSSALTAVVAARQAFVLWRGGGAARLIYSSFTQDSVWTGRWGQSVAIPAAIAIATHSDTIVLGTGAR
jgi:prepilin-type N-terminal cleavage/methylation domain-containing protein